MANGDHDTRTLLISNFVLNRLVVSRGSNDNLDYGTESLASGRSQIRSFDLTNVPPGGYDFATSGTRLGWGLRNSVGMAEHPLTGGLFSVENSCDNFARNGQDVHNDNPGEELNYHGPVGANNYVARGRNFGYPDCFAAWNPSTIPLNSYLRVGTQFSNNSLTDYLCDDKIAPRLTFPSHNAPLDIKFNNSGTEGWITFHGSWYVAKSFPKTKPHAGVNFGALHCPSVCLFLTFTDCCSFRRDRSPPSGYKLSVVNFDQRYGQPLESVTSSNPTRDIVTNADLTKCPNQCFRPVGIIFDKLGRLFMSSDWSGEIYVLTRTNRNAVSSLLSTALSVPTPPAQTNCVPGVQGINPLCKSSLPGSTPTLRPRRRAS